MIKNAYTSARAAVLRERVFPESDWPLGLKVLWFNIDRGVDGITDLLDKTHTHSFYELHFVFEGRIAYACGDRVVSLTDGDAWLLPPMTPHRYTGEGTFYKASLAFSIDERYRELLDRHAGEPFRYSAAMAAHIDTILEQSEREDVFAPALIGNRLLDILYELFSLLAVEVPPKDVLSDSRLAVAKQYIKANRHRSITCEDVARECCLSVKQLNRISQKHTGQPLRYHLIEARISYAKKLVLQNEYSIKEIAYRLGFKNESCFVAFFKRHMSISPGEFRKRLHL